MSAPRTVDSVILFSPFRWDGVHYAPHYFAEELSKSTPVLFVEPRLPWDFSRYDFRGSRLFRAPFADSLTKVHRNLWILQTRSIPFGRFPSIKAWNQSLRLTDIRKAVRKLEFKKPLKWFHFYQSCLDDFAVEPDAAAFYYCIDRFRDPEETELTKRVDFLVVMNRNIFREKQPLNPHSARIPNGCPVGGFLEPQPLPPEYHKIPSPRIGVVAVFSQQIAYNWLADLAEQRSDLSLVLLGPFATGVSGPTPEDLPHLDRLRKSSNVFFLGFKNPGLMPAYIQGLDVGLIPYKNSDYNRFRDPDKLYQYLAAGKPVVSFPVESLDESPPGVFYATSSEQFTEYTQKALDSKDEISIAARIAAGKNSDYSARMSKVLEALQEVVLLPQEHASSGRDETKFQPANSRTT